MSAGRLKPRGSIGSLPQIGVTFVSKAVAYHLRWPWGVLLPADVTAIVLDLANTPVFQHRVALDVQALPPDAVLDAVTELAIKALSDCDERQITPVGLTLAIPALVERADGVVAFAPNLHWTQVEAVEGLRHRLSRPGPGVWGSPPGRQLPIQVDNDANLAALGEFAMGSRAGTQHLVYLTGETGVGGGVMVDGQLLRGAEGFSGEIGHMPLNPGGHLCGCGRRGCWETMVGLAALLRMAAAEDDPVRDPSLDLERRLAMVRDRADRGEPRTLDALKLVGEALGLGASILVNVFNPRVLVLGGYFASLGGYLLDPMLAELHARVIAPDACQVVLSTLGFTAAARGGAHVALEAVLDDPTLVPIRHT